jgi:hypothetical protein
MTDQINRRRLDAGYWAAGILIVAALGAAALAVLGIAGAA